MPHKTTSDAAPAPSDDAIRERAYYLWEADGKPAGRDQYYWHLAQAELSTAPSVEAAAPVKKTRAKAAKPASDGAAKAPEKAPAKSSAKAESKAESKPKAASRTRSRKAE